MVVVEVKGKQFYLDGRLKRQLDLIKRRITKKDSDYVLIVDGEEGSGKSVFVQQICYYIDNNYSIDNMCGEDYSQ